jgi:hypothetical protein
MCLRCGIDHNYVALPSRRPDQIPANNFTVVEKLKKQKDFPRFWKMKKTGVFI